MLPKQFCVNTGTSTISMHVVVFSRQATMSTIATVLLHVLYSIYCCVLTVNSVLGVDNKSSVKLTVPRGTYCGRSSLVQYFQNCEKIY